LTLAAISTDVEMLWESLHRQEGTFVVGLFMSLLQEMHASLTNAPLECPSEKIIAPSRRGGILPKRGALSKRKLNEIVTHSPHTIHSFSTGQLRLEFSWRAIV
jgi:hypothetical protein